MLSSHSADWQLTLTLQREYEDRINTKLSARAHPSPVSAFDGISERDVDKLPEVRQPRQRDKNSTWY